MFHTTRSIVERVIATGNIDGFAVEQASDVELDRVVATDNAANGITVGFSKGTIVRQATVAGNGHGGIVERASSDSRYQRNDISGNAFGIELTQTAAAVLEHNEASRNDGDGIRIAFDATGEEPGNRCSKTLGGAGERPVVVLRRAFSAPQRGHTGLVIIGGRHRGRPG
jgi:parallel beta-helix repeat protein